MKNILNIISRIFALLTTILLGLIFTLFNFNIQNIHDSNVTIALFTTIFLFGISVLHMLTGKYQRLHTFTLLFVFILIILDKNGYVHILKKSSNSILLQLNTKNSRKIDLSKIIKPDFKRVCIFGPYSNNIETEKILGFKWNIEKETSIHLNDSYNVIVFTKDNKIVYYVQYPRKFKDVSNLSGQCFNKRNAIFIRTKTKKGYSQNWIIDNTTPQTNKSNQETKQ